MKNFYNQIKIRKDIENIAFVSPSTGLATLTKCRLFFDSLSNSGKGYSCVLLVFENYEEILEVFYEHAADLMLRQVAKMLQEAIGEKELVGKIRGKAQFIFLLQEDDREQVNKRMYALIQQLQKVGVQRGKHTYDYYGTFSIGTYIISGEKQDFEEVLEMTNKSYNFQLMERGIEQDVITEEQVNRYQRLLKDIPTAMKEGQLSVYFQTVHDMLTDEIVAAELSVKWNHPELGIVFPSEFISLMELSGYMEELDLFVFEEACKLLQGWVQKELVPVPLLVQISSLDFYISDFPDKLKTLVMKYQVPSRLIALEIRADKVSLINEKMVQAEDRLKEMGFSLSFSHFESARYAIELLKCQPTMVRIDARRLTQDLEDQQGLTQIRLLAAMVSISNAKMIVTHIETENQAALYSSVNCNLAQGSLICDEVPKDRYEEIIF
ncbi:bifunctional diguanylate cyclase/phosphodiesterase [Lachnospiraceae bacterium LCP25S3_G4]